MVLKRLHTLMFNSAEGLFLHGILFQENHELFQVQSMIY